MRLQPIIVPGWRNSGPEHWQSQWEASLPRAVRVAQRDWEAPSRDEWVAALAAAIDAANRPALLIAHSLGCMAVCHLPLPVCEKVAGAMLVAPADVERPGAPDRLRSFAPVTMRSLPFQSVVVASSNDPYCSTGRARAFAHAWNSRFELLDDAGHINAESGYGPWPEGLRMLAALRRRACWRVPVAASRTPPLPAGSAVAGGH
ncbi:alpha/beta hydrolase [Pigmentiphaga soli]|uniref:Alpha/beta hydrolase n=1 Tax=Pigmentiphaga soli TaxID=1007095 RepID=A0ABP8GYR7_9BURK